MNVFCRFFTVFLFATTMLGGMVSSEDFSGFGEENDDADAPSFLPDDEGSSVQEEGFVELVRNEKGDSDDYLSPVIDD